MKSGPTMLPVIRHRNQAGASLVDLALVMALLLLLVATIVDLRDALGVYRFVDNAAQQATSYAAERGSACTGFRTACPATAGDISNYVAQMGSQRGMNHNRLQVYTTWIPNNHAGSIVKVRVRYDFPLLFGLLDGATAPVSRSYRRVVLSNDRAR